MTDRRDDLAALRGRLEHRIQDATVVADDANEVLAELREELLELPVPGERRLYGSGSLTTRQLVVLRLLARGHSTRRIAAELFISPATARNHVQAVLVKLAAHTRLGAVMAAQEAGLI